MLAGARSCFLLFFLLAFSFSLAAILPVQAQVDDAPLSPAAPPKKEINDPAEYNAYVAAVEQSDGQAKIGGLEAFLTQYPDSVMKVEALELVMTASQQAGNQPKTLETGQNILQIDACNLRALSLLASTKQTMAQAGQDEQQNIADAEQYGEQGLQCLQTANKPDGMSSANWQKMISESNLIFNSAVGVSAYQAKDYAKAQQYLRAAVEADPTNQVDVYDLALACLAPGPDEKEVDGLFFIARAANLQHGAGKDAIAKFGKSKYTMYHGTGEGWDEVLALTVSAPTPPPAFTISKRVPSTLAEQAAILVNTKKVEEMSFSELEIILSEGTPEDASAVWSALKGKPLQMAARVIGVDSRGTSASSPTKLKLAGSLGDIRSQRADIDLSMMKSLSPKEMPKEGADFSFEGTPISYVAKPFVMTMGKSVELTAKLKVAGSSDREPSSVAALGLSGKPTIGMRNSATPLGPKSFGNPYSWGGCCFFIEPVEVSYTIPYAPEGDDDDDVLDAGDIDAHSQGDPNPPADGAEARDDSAPMDDSVAMADAADQPPPDEPAAEPVAAQSPTVLVFKDGRHSDVLNYAIVGDILFIFDEVTARQILLADLDLPATLKANDDRGVDFQVPAGAKTPTKN